MKLRRDPSGALELMLWDMPAADIDRITKTVLSEAGPVGPVSITHIEGDAINCAIGSGATLTARDLLMVLDGRAGADPVIQELLTRLRRFPLDTDLPEKNNGLSAAEVAAQRAAARFDRALAARKFIDPTSADFGRTKHSNRMHGVNAMRQPIPIKLVGTFIALTSPPLVHHDHQGEFFRWMECNQRRYSPIHEPCFLPGSMPVYMSKAQVWHSSSVLRVPADQTYFTYLAADMEEGYLEYGFNPGSLLKPEGGPVIYAKVIGGFVAILSFLRDLAQTFDSDPTAMSVGLALRGTAGSPLEWISNGGASTKPAEADGFLWRRPATPGTDWTVDNVARQAAVELLEHWSYVGHGGMNTPEFTGGKYTGELARRFMPGNWG